MQVFNKLSAFSGDKLGYDLSYSAMLTKLPTDLFGLSYDLLITFCNTVIVLVSAY
ncbi:MAG: hypothetical protein O2781_02085 [Bacteroidetes bacterium]|nr:hypothetical protein [Bacteroidota bacterium]MDA1009591.1 hypothetical protein [Bacteroidota bacterium]